ncbi:PREDICTED: translation initiation factor IF-2-like [Thamnophis sirtalis]|uniref:Translation initiation factor IF-2-like n=1 Tax=Thamnophis sirtalis TaxID=35019 RepID=A0A6I9YQN6_9SAUR|nr:PREDICTED: translation initiation factor IF-2-like [Thamnophis sirtalis]
MDEIYKLWTSYGDRLNDIQLQLNDDKELQKEMLHIQMLNKERKKQFRRNKDLIQSNLKRETAPDKKAESEASRQSYVAPSHASKKASSSNPKDTSETNAGSEVSRRSQAPSQWSHAAPSHASKRTSSSSPKVTQGEKAASVGSHRSHTTSQQSHEASSHVSRKASSFRSKAGSSVSQQSSHYSQRSRISTAGEALIEAEMAEIELETAKEKQLLKEKLATMEAGKAAAAAKAQAEKAAAEVKAQAEKAAAEAKAQAEKAAAETKAQVELATMEAEKAAAAAKVQAQLEYLQRKRKAKERLIRAKVLQAEAGGAFLNFDPRKLEAENPDACVEAYVNGQHIIQQEQSTNPQANETVDFIQSASLDPSLRTGEPKPTNPDTRGNLNHGPATSNNPQPAETQIVASSNLSVKAKEFQPILQGNLNRNEQNYKHSQPAKQQRKQPLATQWQYEVAQNLSEEKHQPFSATMPTPIDRTCSNQQDTTGPDPPKAAGHTLLIPLAYHPGADWQPCQLRR